MSIYFIYSLASKTLSGVTQLKIGDTCLFIYVCGCTYVIFTLTLTYFSVSSVFNPIPNCTKLFTALNSFAGAAETQQLAGVPFLFELVAVVS